MVGDTALGEIVGADALIAHAGAHLAAAHAAVLGFNALLLDFIEFGSQHAHAFFPVLQLAALFLAGHHNAAGFVDQTNGGGGLVDVLTAGTGGTVDLHFDVRRIDLHVHLFHLGQDCHRGGGGVDTAAGFRFGDTLHPVNAGLVFHPGVGTPAVDDEVRFLHAAQFGLVVVHQFNAPALGGGVHGVHPEQAVGEQGAFLTADTAPDLHNDALVVIGILGQQQDLQLFKQLFLLLFGSGIGLLAELLHFRIAHQFFGIQHILLCLPVSLKSFHDGLQVILFPQQLGSLLGIVIKIRLFGFKTQFFKFIDNCL